MAAGCDDYDLELEFNGQVYLGSVREVPCVFIVSSRLVLLLVRVPSFHLVVSHAFIPRSSRRRLPHAPIVVVVVAARGPHSRVHSCALTHSEGANENRTRCCTDSPAAAIARPKLSTLTSTAPVSFGASGQSLPPMDALATGASASASASPDHLQPGPPTTGTC